MKRKNAQLSSGALILFFLVGCSHDQQSLDGFSQAYTRFREAAALTDQAARMPVERESDYWKAPTDAMNARASNGFRSHAATTALAAYHAQTAPIMAVFSESLDSMDSTVTALIEASNRIKDERARGVAIETAKHARGLQTAYAALVPLYRRRFELQVGVLQDMIAESGALSTIVENRSQSGELVALIEECDQKWQDAADHWQKTKDTFSALKGQFNMKSYPGRWDTDSAAVVTSP